MPTLILCQNQNPFDLFDSNESISNEVDTSHIQAINDSIVEPTSSIPNTAPFHFDTIKKVSTPNHIIGNPFDLTEGKQIESDEEKLPLNEELGLDSIIKEAETEVLLDIRPKKIPVTPVSRNTLVFWLCLFCTLLVAILFNNNRSIIQDIMKAMRNLNFMKLLQKERKNGTDSSFVLLYIIYIINMTILLRFILIHFRVPLFSYRWLFIFLFVLILILIRHFSLMVISYLRKRLPDAMNYSFIISLSNALLGLFLIPINLLIAFGPSSFKPSLIIFSIILVIIFFVIRWFRGLINSLRIIVGDSFHFLLYLCTCEIIPILIGIGYVRNLIF